MSNEIDSAKNHPSWKYGHLTNKEAAMMIAMPTQTHIELVEAIKTALDAKDDQRLAMDEVVAYWDHAGKENKTLRDLLSRCVEGMGPFAEHTALIDRIYKHKPNWERSVVYDEHGKRYAITLGHCRTLAALRSEALEVLSAVETTTMDNIGWSAWVCRCGHQWRIPGNDPAEGCPECGATDHLYPDVSAYIEEADNLCGATQQPEAVEDIQAITADGPSVVTQPSTERMLERMLRKTTTDEAVPKAGDTSIQRIEGCDVYTVVSKVEATGVNDEETPEWPDLIGAGLTGGKSLTARDALQELKRINASARAQKTPTPSPPGEEQAVLLPLPFEFTCERCKQPRSKHVSGLYCHLGDPDAEEFKPDLGAAAKHIEQLEQAAVPSDYDLDFRDATRRIAQLTAQLQKAEHEERHWKAVAQYYRPHVVQQKPCAVCYHLFPDELLAENTCGQCRADAAVQRAQKAEQERDEARALTIVAQQLHEKVTAERDEAVRQRDIAVKDAECLRGERECGGFDYGQAEHQKRFGDGYNRLRTEMYAMPRALRKGDILATGCEVTSDPRDGYNGMVSVELGKDRWIGMAGRLPIALAASDAVLQRAETAEAALRHREQDMEDASGELMVDIAVAQPGSLHAKLLSTNVIMRNQRDVARGEARQRDTLLRECREVV